MFKKILLIVECSDESMEASRVAIALAHTTGARIIAAYVVDMAVVNHLSGFSGKSSDEVAIELEENGWKYLYNIEEEAVAQRVKIALAMEQGRPADKISELARKLQADLLVYARSSEGGTRGVKRAKSTEELISHIGCPILIV